MFIPMKMCDIYGTNEKFNFYAANAKVLNLLIVNLLHPDVTKWQKNRLDKFRSIIFENN